MSYTITELKERYKENLWEGTGGGNEAEIKELLDKLIPCERGFYFSDVNYDDNARTNWSPGLHITNIAKILKLSGRERLIEDKELNEKVSGALRFFCESSFKSLNWWYNEIFIGLNMNPIAIMTEGYIDGAVSEALKSVTYSNTYEAVPAMAACISSRPWKDGIAPNGTWVGANMIWGLINTVTHALYVGNEEMIRVAIKEIEYILECDTGAGINSDGSFYQHGIRWYSGGYGLAFAENIAKILKLIGGSEFSLKEEKISCLLRHVLDGIRWMSVHGYFDYHGVGRNISRIGSPKVSSFANTVKTLLDTEGMPRREELCAMYEDFLREPRYNPNETDEAVVYYPAISHLSHRKSGIYYGISCINRGQLGAEHCNEEGVLCYNMTYGTRTCFMARGNEYLNIDRLMDYSYVPGTTSKAESDEELLAKDRSWTNKKYELDTTRGYAKDGVGIVSQMVKHDTVSLVASYFTYGTTLIALGADIKSDEGAPIHTTIEQCIAEEVEISENHASCGSLTYHALDENCRFCAELLHKRGSASRNSLAEKEVYYEGDVFLASFEDVKDAYAYGVTKRGDKVSAKILENSGACQAILTECGTLMAVFHKDHELLAGKERIAGGAGEIIVRKI